MKHYRLNRLFNPQSNRCFDVAVDHGFFNQPGFLMGIEDMRTFVKTLVLRADVANIYGKELPTASSALTGSRRSLLCQMSSCIFPRRTSPVMCRRGTPACAAP